MIVVRQLVLELERECDSTILISYNRSDRESQISFSIQDGLGDFLTEEDWGALEALHLKARKIFGVPPSEELMEWNS